MELFWHTYSEQCQYIRLTINNKPITIYLNNLIYCEHSNRVTRLVLSNGELLSYTSLRNIYELLPQNRFALCYVLTYSRHIVTLTNCAELPIMLSVPQLAAVLNISRSGAYTRSSVLLQKMWADPNAPPARLPQPR